MALHGNPLSTRTPFRTPLQQKAPFVLATVKLTQVNVNKHDIHREIPFSDISTVSNTSPRLYSRPPFLRIFPLPSDFLPVTVAAHYGNTTPLDTTDANFFFLRAHSLILRLLTQPHLSTPSPLRSLSVSSPIGHFHFHFRSTYAGGPCST